MPTVAGRLEAALELVLRGPITITCAGRTDKGVHGRGQVISFDVPGDLTIDPGRLQASVNKLCAPNIVVRELGFAPAEFNARFSAQNRSYRYRVLNGAVASPLLRRTTWHVPQSLDLGGMNAAADQLLGEQDFTSFCRAPKVKPGEPAASLVRDVRAARWVEGESFGSRLLIFEVTATSFCHQMVRSMVGTLVDIGRIRIAPDELADILQSRDRRSAGIVAPPQGLIFWRVGYPDDY